MLTKDLLPEAGPDADDSSCLKVVMIYSDGSSSKLAAEVCESLKEKLGPGFYVEESSWKLELLRNAKLRTFAAEEAAQSDIIIVAAPESRSIPEEFASWFELWEGERHDSPGALVALLDGRNTANHQDDALKGWLARKASAAHLEFFCHVQADPQPELNENLEEMEAPIFLDNDLEQLDLMPKRFSI
jgi:hypothetical protein